MAQHPMKVVLLDLDGTLTKSDGGIIASVVKTFEELGRPVPGRCRAASFHWSGHHRIAATQPCAGG